MEANTVRLKEHEQAVLVLEKSPRTSTLGSIKYVSVQGVLHAYFKVYSRILTSPLTHLLQVHCDIGNTREDFGALPGVHEDGRTSK